MRINKPITDTEQKFPTTETKLISVTDTHGNITDCNDDFVLMSGFTRDELIGQPHNIIRHPDMPPQAFETMWANLKNGGSWMGLVKNRCKNGDYYWVDAYVTSIKENGTVVGYESVRSCPKPEDVQRAQTLYKRINSQKRFKPRKPLAPENVLLIAALVITLIVFCLGYQRASELILLISVVVYAILSSLYKNQRFNLILSSLEHHFSDALSAASYTDSPGTLGEILVSIRSQASHLNTVTSRIKHDATRVNEQTIQGKQQTDAMMSHFNQQQQETEQAVTAMNEMASTIAEVSQHINATSDNAQNVNELVSNGNQVANDAKNAIVKLKSTVDQIVSSVTSLSGHTQNIATSAQLIEQITEQTNLLALNAAIEAARAGEHGRGFAVVADEVRNLSKRTQESTKEIYSIIDKLKTESAHAVDIASQGLSDAESSTEKVEATSHTLQEITSAIHSIADMSFQMASAVEEQSHVAEDVNAQIHRISSHTNDSSEAANQTVDCMSELKSISDDLHELVIRFQQS
ncbi:methyl-accepting chemotaxis protein [Vibrio salinus]|uniref:methyl-accepting chemotaxis protein n=1 Tax=Vibrio salinus TaxID=2899784 RepID=UPI001E5BFC19|nr:PAS domain-containing methyl-accepting chemotaxis protein [Vibrio salinus]MCE0495601.1 methyl-accepting chemotaxis protein [Vibrio salinus]